jgi:hypothetical protein
LFEIELGDAVALEHVHGVRVLFLEELHEHPGPVDVFHLRRNRVDGRALQHPLDPDGLLRLELDPLGHRLEDLFHELRKILADPLAVAATGLDGLARLGVLEQGEQQVLERDVLVAVVGGLFEGLP